MEKTSEEKIDHLSGRVDTLAEKVDVLAEKVDTLADGLNRLGSNVSRLDSTVDKVVTKLVDMDQYMHTELATKSELHALEDRVLTRFDRQGIILERLDHELASHRGNTDRRLTRVEGHLGLADS